MAVEKSIFVVARVCPYNLLRRVRLIVTYVNIVYPAYNYLHTDERIFVQGMGVVCSIPNRFEARKTNFHVQVVISLPQKEFAMSRSPFLHQKLAPLPVKRTQLSPWWSKCIASPSRSTFRRCLATAKDPQPPKDLSFRGQILESSTRRFKREEAEQERAARERTQAGQGRNIAITFGMIHR